jgi:hypothetical protein
MLCSRRPLPALAALVTAATLAAAPGAGAAAVARLVLEPESALTPPGLDPVPLTGSIEIRLDAFPPATPAAFAVSGLEVTADGIADFALDPGIASPGLGVVFEDGAFLIPTLFLAADLAGGVLPLALPDVEGLLDLGDPALVVLATSFDVELDGGPASVSIVAAPEPEAAALAAAAALALLMALPARGYSSRRAWGTRCQRSGSGWPSRSRKISRKR